MTSKRKPLNDSAGYVCSRKHPLGGWLMLLDRKNGGDWVDADDRWVLVRTTDDLSLYGTLSVQTKAIGYDVINTECRHKVFEIDWGVPLGCPRCDEPTATKDNSEGCRDYHCPLKS